MATFEQRQRNIKALSSQDFDVLIIGGGISGAWLALHCAQSGYRTALIDQADYASQTSSSSSKLLHGGIRYLQQLQFGKVRESAMERAHYIYAAPHLSEAVPFIIPTYKDLARSKLLLSCGMWAYGVLCLGENAIIDSPEQRIPATRFISAQQLNEFYDLGVEEHTGAVVFHERHMRNSERMVLSILRTAQELGAQIQNYVKADHYLRDADEIKGVRAVDQRNGETFEISSRLVINAAGPWIDTLDADLQVENNTNTIAGFAVGSHVVCRQLSNHAIAITTRHQSETKIDRGGRHVFVIPWRGFSLIGTSYNEIDNPENDLSIKPEHVQQLLDAVNQGLPHARLSRADLISGYSGLYPLRTGKIDSAVYQGSGEYQIIDHQKSNRVAGVVTALGAKFTTGRKLSAKTMQLVAEKLGGGCDLNKRKLHNSAYQNAEQFRLNKISEFGNQFDAITIDHLFTHYGSDIDNFIAEVGTDAMLKQAIVDGQPDILGQVVWAVKHEQACTLSDVVFRRTSTGLMGISRGELRRVADVMAQASGWDEDQLEQQVSTTLRQIDAMQQALHGGHV